MCEVDGWGTGAIQLLSHDAIRGARPVGRQGQKLNREVRRSNETGGGPGGRRPVVPAARREAGARALLVVSRVLRRSDPGRCRRARALPSLEMVLLLLGRPAHHPHLVASGDGDEMGHAEARRLVLQAAQ